MKKFSRIMLAAGLSTTLIVQSGCFGTFQLVRNVYTWNEGLSESKFVQTLIFYVLNIIPVYGIAGFLDFVIFNLIEFWSGSNPLALKEGETEEQTVMKDGITYHMKATKNTLSVTQVDGKEAGKTETLVYSEKDKTWNLEKDGNVITVARLKTSAEGLPVADIYNGKGKTISLSLPSNEENLAQAVQKLHSFKTANVAVK